MPDEDRPAIHPGKFIRDPCFPRLILGAVFVWHPRRPHVVRVPEFVPQASGHFSVFLICSFTATVNEEYKFLHAFHPPTSNLEAQAAERNGRKLRPLPPCSQALPTTLSCSSPARRTP